MPRLRHIAWALPLLLAGCSLGSDTEELGSDRGNGRGGQAGSAGGGGSKAGGAGSSGAQGGATAGKAGAGGSSGKAAAGGSSAQAGGAGAAGSTPAPGGSSAGGAPSGGAGGSLAAGGATAGAGGSFAAGGANAGTGGSATAGGASGAGGSSATAGSSSGLGGAPSGCGDGVRDKAGGEQCDGADFDDLTCKEWVNPLSTGALGCSPDCKVVTSGCSVCGDNVKDPDEQCDGTDVDPSVTCQSLLGGNSTGTVGCRADCYDRKLNCSVACNPLTGSECGSKTCDFMDFGLFVVIDRLRCLPSGGTKGVCEACSSAGLGAASCKPGLHCDGKADRCTPFCATDSDCVNGGTCDLGAGADGVGICVGITCGAAGAGGGG